jgi:hypothetical protein
MAAPIVKKKQDNFILLNTNQSTSRNNIGVEVYDCIFDGTGFDCILPTTGKTVIGWTVNLRGLLGSYSNSTVDTGSAAAYTALAVMCDSVVTAIANTGLGGGSVTINVKNSLTVTGTNLVVPAPPPVNTVVRIMLYTIG